ncbi:Os07g0545001, partial [Oryza sativa Japonica Group]
MPRTPATTSMAMIRRQTTTASTLAMAVDSSSNFACFDLLGLGEEVACHGGAKMGDVGTVHCFSPSFIRLFCFWGCYPTPKFYTMSNRTF